MVISHIRVPSTAQFSSSFRRLHTSCSYRINLDNNVVAIAPSRRQARGIVFFVGGAFAGAVPTQTYGSFLDQITNAGYTVIATPYAVTFQHEACAQALHTTFNTSLTELRMGRHSWAAPVNVPTHGLGHSNGALMHAMIASLFSPRIESNVLISYNNRQVGEAVPLPLDAVSPVLRPVAGTLESMSENTVNNIYAFVQGTGIVDQEVLRLSKEMVPAVTQLGRVFDEVGSGVSDFKPTPTENQALFAANYSVPNSLLLQFTDDAIDQTAELARILRGRSLLNVTEKRLPGNHLTPVGPSPNWNVGGAFGPLEALGQTAVTFMQSEQCRAAREVIAWLEAFN